jgi:hypothetical protein
MAKIEKTDHAALFSFVGAGLFVTVILGLTLENATLRFACLVATLGLLALLATGLGHSPRDNVAAESS